MTILIKLIFLSLFCQNVLAEPTQVDLELLTVEDTPFIDFFDDSPLSTDRMGQLELYGQDDRLSTDTLIFGISSERNPSSDPEDFINVYGMEHQANGQEFQAFGSTESFGFLMAKGCNNNESLYNSEDGILSSSDVRFGLGHQDLNCPSKEGNFQVPTTNNYFSEQLFEDIDFRGAGGPPHVPQPIPFPF